MRDAHDTVEQPAYTTSLRSNYKDRQMRMPLSDVDPVEAHVQQLSLSQSPPSPKSVSSRSDSTGGVVADESFFKASFSDITQVGATPMLQP